jgi:arabinan endo-1,5-alpha-L-arabinosidase
MVAAFTSLVLSITGATKAHDPSTIIREGDRYYCFTTGVGIVAKVSDDLKAWRDLKPIFPSPPDWTKEAVPEFRGHFWAPDVAKFGERYWVYYSVSSFGKQVSALGVVSSPTLDPEKPEHVWTDHGPVIRSKVGDPYNAIDPAVFVEDDRVWLTFGSHWTGIYLFEVDPRTGLRKDASQEPIQLANYKAIEAPYITKRGEWYYLFVNFDRCCNGKESTYNIRVGRSRTVTGPYVDRDGKDMREGGGTMVLKTEGDRIGPGHAGIYVENGVEYFSFHYYDGATEKGTPTLGIRTISWDSEGWPIAAP